MSRLSIFAALLVPFAVACDKDREGNGNNPPSGMAMPSCEDTASPMTPDEESTFGLLGQDFLARIPAELDGIADVDGGTSAVLEMSVHVDVSTLRAVASEPAPIPPNVPVAMIAVYCSDRVEVDAQVEFFTEDGQLAEVLSVVLVATDGEDPDAQTEDVFFRSALGDDFEGSLSIEDFVDPAEYDSIALSMSGGFIDQAFRGEVVAMGEVQMGNAVTAELISMVSLQAEAVED